MPYPHPEPKPEPNGGADDLAQPTPPPGAQDGTSASARKFVDIPGRGGTMAAEENMGGGRRIVALVLSFAVGLAGGYGVSQAVKDDPEPARATPATPTPEATPKLPDPEWVLFEDVDDEHPVAGAAFTESVAIDADEGCDKGKLKQLLNDEPSTKRAWLELQGVAADQFDAFVDRLASATLEEHTPVTDHGYFPDLDQGFAFDAILAEGTLVLADPEQDNRPVVRCMTGDPLRPPKCPPNCLGVSGSPTPSPAPRRTLTPRRTRAPVRTATPRPTVRPSTAPTTQTSQGS